jgi:ABC-type sugar transport system ATPase subunit
MDEIFSICDDVTVMRDGAHVVTRPIDGLDKDSLVALMVGRELTNLFPKIEVEIGDDVLKVEKLTRNGVFSDVSFSVRRGEIVGLSGLMGAGRTAVARAIFGLDEISSGKMYLEDKGYEVKRPRDAIHNGIAYVPEDRKLLGLCLERPILENISLPNLEMFSKYGLLDLSFEREKAEDISRKL